MILFCLNNTVFPIAQTNFFDRKNAFYDHDFTAKADFWTIRAFVIAPLLVECNDYNRKKKGVIEFLNFELFQKPYE